MLLAENAVRSVPTGTVNSGGQSGASGPSWVSIRPLGRPVLGRMREFLQAPLPRAAWAGQGRGLGEPLSGLLALWAGLLWYPVPSEWRWCPGGSEGLESPTRRWHFNPCMLIGVRMEKGCQAGKNWPLLGRCPGQRNNCPPHQGPVMWETLPRS